MRVISYGNDVLAPRPRREVPKVHAVAGLVVEDVDTGFVGEIMRVGRVAGTWQVELEDRHARRRSFPLGRGFWIEGQAVELVRPPVAHKPQRRLTASGSVDVQARARVAKASRIWVEGKHDAELVAKVWGKDLALEGIVVEELQGVDRLEEAVAEFAPSASRRLGILVDHLVDGSKESRIAERVAHHSGLLVLGHPYVDVWQAVRPERLGLNQWPTIPRGEDIKVGTLRRLGWPHATAQDVGLGWARILQTVRSYKDLEASLLGRMEELIDFVTAEGTR